MNLKAILWKWLPVCKPYLQQPRSYPITLFLVVNCFALGCAKIEYVKVPSPTQYSTWSDKNQASADEIKGVRYYLPRPFLNLKQSIPVAQRVAFVSFDYHADGADGPGYYLQLPDSPPVWLKRLAPKRISVTQALAATLASRIKGKANDDKGEESTDAGGTASQGDEAQKKEDKTSQGNQLASELTARTGFISDTDPVTRLGAKMDIVYLPDFEEQYVIRSKPGIGQANIETKLRNGWAAEVFSQQVDNSNLIPYVIRQVESASEAAAGIATTWLPVAAGLPPGTTPAAVADLAKDLSSGEESTLAGIDNDKAVKFLGGTLIFKIAEVKMAQPGVYPILKPREVLYWMKTDTITSDTDMQTTFELFLKQKKLPWVRPDMAFIPAPPFTMVGFNVTTDAFLMPATERLVLESTNESTPKTDPWEKNKAKIEKALISKISTSMSSLDAKFNNGGQYDLKASQKRNGADTKIELRTKNLASALTAPEQVNGTFKTWIKDTFHNISDGQITVDFTIANNIVVITITESASTLVANIK